MKNFTLNSSIMKKILAGFALIATFTACTRDRSTPERNVVLVQDTFRMYNNSILTDKAAETQQYAVAEPVKKATRTTTRRSTASNSTAANSTAQAPVETKKKGWSKAAKGTAIGAGSGAVAGAIISGKNRGKGAIIGGVIGAAGGYIIGRAQDKKDGRY